MKKKTSIKKNFIMNAILMMSSFIFPLISFPYVSRVLGPDGIGKVQLATSWVNYFNMFAQLGIPTYGIRACARVRDDKEKLSCTVHELLTINLVLGAISYSCFFVLVTVNPRMRADKELYIITSSIILLNAIGMEWLYKGLEQYSYITKRSVLFKFLAVIGMLALVHKKSDYVVFGFLSIFASSASNIVNFINSRKIVKLFKTGRHYNYSQHFKAIGVFFAMSVAITFYTNLDTVMLGSMATETDVGYYNAATKIKMMLVSLVTSLGTVLLPRASYYIEHGEKERFLEISKKAINFVWVIATPLMVFFIYFAKQGILFLSGKEFTGAIIPMEIIMPTLLFIGLSNILGLQMLVPLGKEKIVLYSEVSGALTDLIINALLIPNYKSSGAAVGTVIAEFVVLAVQYIYLKSTVRTIFAEVSYWKIIVALVVSSVTSLAIPKLGLSNLLTLLVAALIFFASYFIVLIACKESFALYMVSQMKLVFQRIKKK